MQFKIKSQLDHIEKGGILDDCGPSSTAAAVSWAAGYAVDYTAADGIEAKKKATGQVDRDGVADNGSSLADLAKTAKLLGATPRYPKSWADVVESAKAGAGLIVWVQQPVGYPAGVEISAWHARHIKRHPAEAKSGYGHMTAAGWCADHGWQWACPTRSGKGAEAVAVPVTEEQLRQIADSKRVSGKHKAEPFKHILIVTHPARAKAPQPATAAEPQAPARIAVEAPTRHAEPRKAAEAIKTPPAKQSASASRKTASAVDPAVKAQLDALGRVDWATVGADALDLVNQAAAASGKEKGMSRILSALRYIAANSQIDEMLLDAVRTFLTVSISVALGLGIPLLDIQGGDFRTIVSAGLASALQIIVKALDPQNSAYGVKRK